MPLTIGVRDLVVNQELPSIRAELSKLIAADKADAHLYFLYGIVLRETQDTVVMAKVVESRRNEALFEETSTTAHVKSLNLFPWNWSAWLDLAHTITSESHLASVITSLKPHLLVSFFEAHALSKLGHFTRALLTSQSVYKTYPTLKHTKRSLAVTLVDSGLYAESLPLFEDLRASNPHDLDNMDQYANALNETRQTSSLTKLAMSATTTARWTTQACLIVSRFHASQGSYKMAAVMSGHAMKLDPQEPRVWEAVAQPTLSSNDLPRRIACLHNAIQVTPHNVRYKAQIGAAYVFRVPSHAYYNLATAQTSEALEKQDWAIIGFSLDNMNSAPAKQLSKLIRSTIDPVSGHFADPEAEIRVKRKLFKLLQGNAIASFDVFEKYVRSRVPETEIFREVDSSADMDASVQTPVRMVRREAMPDENDQLVDGDDEDGSTYIDMDDVEFDDEEDAEGFDDVGEDFDGEGAMELDGDDMEMEMEMDDDI